MVGLEAAAARTESLRPSRERWRELRRNQGSCAVVTRRVAVVVVVGSTIAPPPAATVSPRRSGTRAKEAGSAAKADAGEGIGDVAGRPKGRRAHDNGLHRVRQPPERFEPRVIAIAGFDNACLLPAGRLAVTGPGEDVPIDAKKYEE